jgi:hypothetical protein
MYGVQNFRDVHAPDEEERQIVHIAFHVSPSYFFPVVINILIRIGFPPLFFRTAYRRPAYRFTVDTQNRRDTSARCILICTHCRRYGQSVENLGYPGGPWWQV